MSYFFNSIIYTSLCLKSMPIKNPLFSSCFEMTDTHWYKNGSYYRLAIHMVNTHDTQNSKVTVIALKICAIKQYDENAT